MSGANISYETTTSQDSIEEAPWDILLVVIWSIVTLGGLFSNILLLSAFAASRMLQTASGVLIINTMVTDFVLCCALPLQAVALLSSSFDNLGPLVQPMCAAVAVILVACTWSRLFTIGVLSHQRLLRHQEMSSCWNRMYTPANLISFSILTWIFPVTAVVVPAVAVRKLELRYEHEAQLCILSGPSGDVLVLHAIALFLWTMVSLITVWNYIKSFVLERKRKRAKMFRRKKRRPNPRKDPQAFLTPESPFEEVQQATLFMVMQDQKNPFRCNVCGLDKKEHTKQILRSHDQVRSQNLARSKKLLSANTSSVVSASNQIKKSPPVVAPKPQLEIHLPPSFKKGSQGRRNHGVTTGEDMTASSELASRSFEMDVFQRKLPEAPKFRTSGGGPSNHFRSNNSIGGGNRDSELGGHSSRGYLHVDSDDDTENDDDSTQYNANQSHKNGGRHWSYRDRNKNSLVKTIFSGSFKAGTRTRSSKSSKQASPVNAAPEDLQIGITQSLSIVSVICLAGIAPVVFCSEVTKCPLEFHKFALTAHAVASLASPIVLAFRHPNLAEVVGHIFHRRFRLIPSPTKCATRCLQP
ncbi:uncharacterized protein [Diadema antillarum]|uniref:uncharacterized protein n=1 Tax=Diadema antillarum TaxID=105358 RepID=UPI003A89B79A